MNNTEMDLVSIIIPVHNAEIYINETILCCFSQTYTNIEIILVENGSADRSWDVISAYNDRRIKPYQIPKGNAAKARNFGFSKAQGAYCMFLDADDIISSNKIELQINQLKQHKPGHVASCAWGKFSTDIEEATFIPQPVWTEKDPVKWCISAWQGNGMMVTACWLIPSALIQKVNGWDEQLSLHDDGEFMCRILLASEGNIFVNDAKVFYRQSTGSLSKQNKSQKAAQSALNTYCSYQHHILQHSDTKEIRMALAKNYAQFLYEFHPNYKSLLLKAKGQLNNLGFRKFPIVGGDAFKKLARKIGFMNALRIRHFFYD